MNGESWAPISEVTAEYRVVQRSGEPLQSCARGRDGELSIGQIKKKDAIRKLWSKSIAK